MKAPSRSQLVAVAVTIAATTAVAAGAASFAIKGLNYGLCLFIGIPYFMGFFSTAIYRINGPKRLRDCMAVGLMGAFCLSSLFLIFGFEGVICILMAAPICVPFVLLGTGMAYIFLHRSKKPRPLGMAITMMLLLSLSLWIEGQQRRSAPSYTVTDSIRVSASQSVVWDSLVGLGPLGQPHDWLFRLGVACPERVEIRGTGIGAIRTCTLSTGELDEEITSWEPGRHLGWVTLRTPPPLKELNPFRATDPPHLHGFYRSISGAFELRPLGADETLVVRTSTYQHNLYPATYWRIWCDHVASRGHLYVLGILKEAAEHEAQGSAQGVRRIRPTG